MMTTITNPVKNSNSAEKRAVKVSTVRHSGGMRFGSAPEKKVPRKPDKEREKFAGACPSYGLAPDFYQETLVINEQEFSLIGFSGNFARVRAIDGTVSMIPFETALDGMIEEIRMEMKEMPKKAELLECSKASLRRAKKVLRNRAACVNQARRVWNGNMQDVFSRMGVPLYAGFSDSSRHIYEFVSWREDLGYILEDISISSNTPDRFKEVTFDRLIDGLKKYAEMENNIPALLALESAVPADADPGEKTEEQQSIFAFL